MRCTAFRRPPDPLTHPPTPPSFTQPNRYSMKWPVIIILWAFLLVFRLASILSLKVRLVGTGRGCGVWVLTGQGVPCSASPQPCPYRSCGDGAMGG